MYSYVWDPETRGYLLTTESGKFVANEIRPVFAEELKLTGMCERFEFNSDVQAPLLWAQKNYYFLNGEKVAQLNGTRYGSPLNIEYFFEGKRELKPVDVKTFVEKNARIMELVVVDAKRRTKELFDKGAKISDISYVAFSGGKDSVVTLDICHRVLPLSTPVIYSDTRMDLPASLDVWKEVQQQYPEREFIRVCPKISPIESWKLFGPPARNIRWCCSVLKTSPVIAYLKEKLNQDNVRATAFVGVRSEESLARSNYDDFSSGVKNSSQVNCMPILDWGAHELWLYIFANKLSINAVYRKGLTRVGCLICPESSNKYLWFVDKIYPNVLDKFNEVIFQTSNKHFQTKEEQKDFIASLNWQARKSGVVLAETLSNPIESTRGLIATYKSPFFKKKTFLEWIKTIGSVTKASETETWNITLPNEVASDVSFTYREIDGNGGGIVTFTFASSEIQTTLAPLIRDCFRKITACVGCGSCEAECPFGAIKTVDNGIEIDGLKCTRCHNCYNIDYSCWRFRSMRDAELSRSPEVSVNSYKNFGFRETKDVSWIRVLIELGEDFFPYTTKHPLGKKMVESARTWFIQSELIDPKTKSPTKLLELFKRFGSSYVVGWEFIWISLVNKAPLLKWFATDIETSHIYSVEDLQSKLGAFYPSLGKSSLEGGIAAFKDMFTKNPLGLRAETLESARKMLNPVADASVAYVEATGKSTVKTKQIERRSKSVSSLTILYGLYFIARLSERSSFTVREMLRADKDSTFVSPLVAFGIPSDVFKRQCEGLRTKYPDYISTTFTHGNDEVQVFPDKFGTDDIIDLVLSEN